MNLDEHTLRSSTPENFMHNFRVACMQADNLDEAMEMAKILVDSLTSYGRKRFNRERNAIGAEAFDEKLRKIYEEASKDKEYHDVSLTDGKVDVGSKLFNEDAKEHPERYELPYGSKIGETNTCVGDTIKMAMTFKSFDGKIRKTPATDFKIMKVSQNLHPEKVVLYSEIAKCTYSLPLKDVISHIQKVERKQEKEKLKQFKTEQKKYKYNKDEYKYNKDEERSL